MEGNDIYINCYKKGCNKPFFKLLLDENTTIEIETPKEVVEVPLGIVIESFLDGEYQHE